jgi:hypothetical protein
MEPDEGFDRDAASYVSLQGKPKARQFGIVVWEVPKEDRRQYQKGDFGGEGFLIGGDDATATSQKAVRVNGLLGREYVHAEEISEDTYTRGRIFYAGGRLYTIVFVAKTAEDLMSADANRFLDSFRVRRTKNPVTAKKGRGL